MPGTPLLDHVNALGASRQARRIGCRVPAILRAAVQGDDMFKIAVIHRRSRQAILRNRRVRGLRGLQKTRSGFSFGANLSICSARKIT